MLYAKYIKSSMGKFKLLNKDLIRNIIVPVVLIIGTIIFFRIIGSQTNCIFRNIIGIPCFACGMSRAFTSLFSGNINMAFYYHPLWIIPILLCIIFILKYKISFFKKIWENNYFWGLLLIIFLITYIIRMYYMFPEIPPLKYYENNLISNLVKILKNL